MEIKDSAETATYTINIESGLCSRVKREHLRLEDNDKFVRYSTLIEYVASLVYQCEVIPDDMLQLLEVFSRCTTSEEMFCAAYDRAEVKDELVARCVDEFTVALKNMRMSMEIMKHKYNVYTGERK
jgi:hypothetical protein